MELRGIVESIRVQNIHRVFGSSGKLAVNGDKVTLGKTLLAFIACSASLLGPLDGSTIAKTLKGCTEPKIGTSEVPLFSPPLINVVVGVGRVQFYSAPSFRCPMHGVFVIPKDELIAYAQSDDGWSSVMYTNPGTGDHVSGWVRSVRLKETGTVGPKQ